MMMVRMIMMNMMMNKMIKMNMMMNKMGRRRKRRALPTKAYSLMVQLHNDTMA
jgi:hypothetical protein